MDRIKAIWMIIVVFGGVVRASVADLSELEGLRLAYPHYEISDIFGAAKLITSILKNSEQLKALLHDPGDILRATLLVGSIAAVVKISIAAVNALSMRLPTMFSRASRYVASRFRKLLGIAEGFDCNQLRLFEQTFEQVMAVWLDQGYRGADSTLTDRECRQFQCRFVRDTLSYITNFLREHQHYYRTPESGAKRKTCVEEDLDHVSFLIRHLINALHHLMALTAQAEDQQAFDLEHTKKMARMTIVLFKKLSAILSGEDLSGYNQSEYMFGQSLVPITGITEL